MRNTPHWSDVAMARFVMRWYSIRMEAVHRLFPAAAAGCVGGLVATAGLIVLDAGALRTLIAASPQGWIAAMVLAISMMITFGSVAIGVEIQRMGWDE